MLNKSFADVIVFLLFIIPASSSLAETRYLNSAEFSTLYNQWVSFRSQKLEGPTTASAFNGAQFDVSGTVVSISGNRSDSTTVPLTNSKVSKSDAVNLSILCDGADFAYSDVSENGFKGDGSFYAIKPSGTSSEPQLDESIKHMIKFWDEIGPKYSRSEYRANDCMDARFLLPSPYQLTEYYVDLFLGSTMLTNEFGLEVIPTDLNVTWNFSLLPVSQLNGLNASDFKLIPMSYVRKDDNGNVLYQYSGVRILYKKADGISQEFDAHFKVTATLVDPPFAGVALSRNDVILRPTMPPLKGEWTAAEQLVIADGVQCLQSCKAEGSTGALLTVSANLSATDSYTGYLWNTLDSTLEPELEIINQGACGAVVDSSAIKSDFVNGGVSIKLNSSNSLKWCPSVKVKYHSRIKNDFGNYNIVAETSPFSLFFNVNHAAVTPNIVCQNETGLSLGQSASFRGTYHTNGACFMAWKDKIEESSTRHMISVPIYFPGSVLSDNKWINNFNNSNPSKSGLIKIEVDGKVYSSGTSQLIVSYDRIDGDYLWMNLRINYNIGLTVPSNELYNNRGKPVTVSFTYKLADGNGIVKTTSVSKLFYIKSYINSSTWNNCKTKRPNYSDLAVSPTYYCKDLSY